MKLIQLLNWFFRFVIYILVEPQQNKQKSVTTFCLKEIISLNKKLYYVLMIKYDLQIPGPGQVDRVGVNFSTVQ